MIRLLIALIIVAVSLTMLSGMVNKKNTSQTSSDTAVGEVYEPHHRAQQFSEEEYENALDSKREDLDKQIDGG